MKELAGDKRVTIILIGKAGAQVLCRWFENGVDVITYRKGHYEPWAEDGLSKPLPAGGQPVIYRLGERSIMVSKNFWMREVRRLCASGHQTSVMTTARICQRRRRRQDAAGGPGELFKYMRQEYNWITSSPMMLKPPTAIAWRLSGYKDKLKQIAG